MTPVILVAATLALGGCATAPTPLECIDEEALYPELARLECDRAIRCNTGRPGEFTTVEQCRLSDLNYLDRVPERMAARCPDAVYDPCLAATCLDLVRTSSSCTSDPCEIGDWYVGLCPGWEGTE